MPSSDTSRLRPKPQLSCIPCRRNKVKCSRGRPCTRCLVRGLAESCSYKAVRGDDKSRVGPTPVAATGASIRPSTMSSMRSCIDELEMLIRSLKRSSKPGAGTVASGQEDLRWAAVLERISQLRTLLDQDNNVTHEECAALLPSTETSSESQPAVLAIDPGETPRGGA